MKHGARSRGSHLQHNPLIYPLWLQDHTTMSLKDIYQQNMLYTLRYKVCSSTAKRVSFLFPYHSLFCAANCYFTKVVKTFLPQHFWKRVSIFPGLNHDSLIFLFGSSSGDFIYFKAWASLFNYQIISFCYH